MPQRQYAIVEAPSILGLKPTGVDRLPDTLMSNGLADRLNARRACRLEAPAYSGDRDPVTRTLNAHSIAAWTPRLADAVENVLDHDEFPLILGGDCSILLGAMLALRRRGRYGLMFVDGHADFYQPEVNPNGEAASMELAFATGYGPALLCDFEGRRPLVRSEDVVAFGFRDAEEQRMYGSQPLPADMLVLDLPSVRHVGLPKALSSAMERLTRPGLDGFFLHIDADSLDDSVMPAVDYRIPGGFAWEELTAIVTTALASSRAAGMEVTIYNPALDNGGASGKELTNVLVTALRS